MTDSSPPILRLMVDSGNTRVKWGLHDGNGWIERGSAAQADGALLGRQWREMEAPDHILICHVAGVAAKNGLVEALSHWEIEPQWISAATYQCGVRNYYADPAQLGSDRWAALVAAWDLQRQGCLVVDAGTALTVDALSDTGEFLGGIIIPGMDMMRAALAAHLVPLTAAELSGGAFRDYPDSTADAVASGGVHALAGAVERMAGLLAATLGHVPDCLLCGGAAQQLQPRLELNATVVENLVLEGLLLIAREGGQDSRATARIR
ncbi:type III pantothenate kinase [Nitrosovibrio sp. Nv17]|uniref:type III pantothenate kinase n=1 Tax=Nitrosovibrio sp. Nv17 TaxID=1855339 RepID=UPI000908F4C0|nr:type III pantothenate kinase [Nitrosovibrio sp. Nv17]SFW36451.1 type III pantothenate kinase [Nitrosovibrio sp. Nv17]